MSLAEARPPRAVRLGRFLADHPTLILILLFLLLVGVLQFMQPGIVSARWAGNTVKFAIPLAMLAACQVMTMLTGGIDMSAGAVATISAFVVATQTPMLGPGGAIIVALLPGLALGLVNGLGVGVFRVHPLIMTLATSLIGIGCLQVYQRGVIASGSVVPPILEWLGTGLTWGFPNALLVFVPFAALILWGERRTGFGRLLYAVGANEGAARMAGVRTWQVYLALYALSGVIAAIAGLLYVGLIKAPSLSLALPLLLPSVAAAVIGGTSIFGGRGGFAGAIVGALILRVMETLLLLTRMPEGMRTILFGLIIIVVTTAYLRLTGRD
jgi:ribose transport system permease protein